MPLCHGARNLPSSSAPAVRLVDASWLGAVVSYVGAGRLTAEVTLTEPAGWVKRSAGWVLGGRLPAANEFEVARCGEPAVVGEYRLACGGGSNALPSPVELVGECWTGGVGLLVGCGLRLCSWLAPFAW